MKTQYLINAQISVSRAVFEINKPGRTIFPGEDPKISKEYVLEQVKNAIRELQIVRKSIRL